MMHCEQCTYHVDVIHEQLRAFNYVAYTELESMRLVSNNTLHNQGFVSSDDVSALPNAPNTGQPDNLYLRVHTLDQEVLCFDGTLSILEEKVKQLPEFDASTVSVNDCKFNDTWSYEVWIRSLM